ncbi:class I SAM-dependent methyltransferase [Nostoc sp. LEGE 06077]|uniref:class I SAM-dependent methyltransferase n=1 Tax=Nostoc sp. LEGE 06077 TaxID=915325 RepID=UPI00187ECACC|nr:class I SAM-dependent methyltransferase [Nostoc sp. LEGE 06077]MBE9209212.1 class I SAM-dependent methyltransferase [Nostoc sp. LEGE 06077]
MVSREEALEKTKTIFNTASDYFDAPALSFWNRFGRKTIERISLNKGNFVLDVCCGTGASAIPAAVSVGSNGRVLGIDIAESLLELARHKSQLQGLDNIEFRSGDFENLGLTSSSFDAVVCVFGIFFVPDMVAAVQELWRMVRPGGKLAITSWGKKVFEPGNQIFWDAIKTERPDLYRSFTPWDRIADPASLQALLEAGGATQVEVFEELGTHELTSAEDWWTIVLGGGFRGTIDQLEPTARERVRQANLEYLRTNNVHSLSVDVLYAIAQKL